jgi:hypothetical protein
MMVIASPPLAPNFLAPPTLGGANSLYAVHAHVQLDTTSAVGATLAVNVLPLQAADDCVALSVVSVATVNSGV